MFRFTLLLLATLVPAMAQVKVGAINVQSAILETAEIKKAQAELEAKYKPRQAKLEALNKELSDLQNRLQSMAGKLTPSAEADMQLQGQRKQKEAQRLAEDLQADVDRDRNDILAKSGDRMQAVVKKLAEEKQLDVVLDVSQALYVKPTLDLTKEATTAYDKAYPAK
jgi:outer membrane protein